jgi:hypothetical protein
MQHPQSRPYGDRAKLSSAIVFPPPTDLLTISAAAKTLPKDSEATVRQWVDRGLLPSHANPKAGRRPRRGRPVTRWVSLKELKDFMDSRIAKMGTPKIVPLVGENEVAS